MTDDTLLPFHLPAVQRKKVTAAFDGGLISSDGGLVLLREAERHLGVNGGVKMYRRGGVKMYCELGSLSPLSMGGPRAGRRALRAAGGGPRVGGACGPTRSSGVIRTAAGVVTGSA